MIKRTTLALALATLLVVSAAAADWYPHWFFRQQIAVATNKVAGTLTNFSILITHDNVRTDLWARATADGHDILFTAADGVTKLAHEIERYDPVATQLCAWVKIPLLTYLETNIIYLYYDGRTNKPIQQNPTSVWDAGYIGVWHFSETNGLVLDSTAHHYDLTPTNGLYQNATGMIAGAIMLDTNRAYCYNTNLNENVVTNITAVAWINIPDPTNDPTYKAICREYYQFSFEHVKNSAGQFYSRYLNTNAVLQAIAKSSAYGAPQAGQWYQVAVTRAFSGNNCTVYFYRNGVDFWGATALSGYPQNTFNELYVGGEPGVVQSMSGRLDELQLARETRSPAWLTTLYNNQSAPSNFAFPSAEERGMPTMFMFRAY